MAQISPRTVADATARDAITTWEAGDIVFLVDPGVMTYFDGSAWQEIAVVVEE